MCEKLPYIATRETSIQSLQYQILNRYYPCKEKLAVWYNHHDVFCYLCEESVDSLEHYFYQCVQVKCLWGNFTQLFYNIYSVSIEIGCLDILFGIMNPNRDVIISVLNFCILQGKLYIKKTKLSSGVPSFRDFCLMLKKRLEVEKLLCQLENKIEFFTTKYEALYIGLCNVA